MQTKLKISFILALLFAGLLSQGQNGQSNATPTKTIEQLQKENERC